MLTKGIAALLILLSKFLSACDQQSPAAPSSPPSPAATPPSQAPVTDSWNITVRQTAVTGGECVGETMRAQIGLPQSYVLSVTRKGSTADVTLKSTSGDYACTFPGARLESDRFTTAGVSGYYTCQTSLVIRGFTCANGMTRDIQQLGQNISGRFWGNEISGEWDVSWIVMKAGGSLSGQDDIAALETKAQYTGSR